MSYGGFCYQMWWISTVLDIYGNGIPNLSQQVFLEIWSVNSSW